MMKRSLLLFAFVILPLFTLKAQYAISEGPELVVEKDAKFDRIIGSDEEFFYVYRIKTRGAGTRYFVEKYDKETLNQVFSKDLNLEQSEDISLDPNLTNTYALLSGSNIYVIFPIYFKKLNKKILALKVVRDDGSLEPGRMELDVSTGNTEYNFVSSPDQSKFSIVRTVKENGKLDNVHIKQFNSGDLEMLWEKELPNNYRNSGIHILSYAINNEGLLSFFFLYYKNYETKDIGVSMALFDVPNDASNALDLNIEKGKEPYSMFMKYVEGNKLACMGIFKDPELTKEQRKNKITRRAGVYYYVLDIATMEILSEGSKYFPSSVSEELTYASPDGFHPGDKYYTASKLIEEDNNYYYITEHGYNYTGGSTSKIRRELIVSKIDKGSGELEWIRLLQKQSANKSGMFNVVAKDGKLNIFCLEHEKAQSTFDKGDTFDPGKFPMATIVKDCNVRAYKVHSDGEVEKSIIYKNEDFAYEPQYDEFFLNDANQLLIYLLQGDREKFGVLEVK